MKLIAPLKSIIARNNALNIIALLLLGFYILYPTVAFAPKTEPKLPDYQTQNKDKEEQSSDQSNNKQKPSTNVGQDETTTKNLFKDATYENFAPQDDKKTEIFDEDYLEKRK